MEFTAFHNQIWTLLREITDGMAAILRPVSDRFGLTVGQLRVLLEIHQSAHTVGSLSKRIGIAGANASSLCKRLEQLGYLERVRDNRDERVVRVALTPAGLALIESVESDLMERLAPLLKTCPENLTSILDGLGKLSELLHQADADRTERKET